MCYHLIFHKKSFSGVAEFWIHASLDNYIPPENRSSEACILFPARVKGFQGCWVGIGGRVTKWSMKKKGRGLMRKNKPQSVTH